MHLLKGLDQEAHEKVMRKINMIMKEQKTSTLASTKRKMEKQDYYPAKR
jgi:hypothetical protein